MAFQLLEMLRPSWAWSLYAPCPTTLEILYGPSQVGPSLPALGSLVFWKTRRSTQSPALNVLARMFLLYYCATCWW